MRLRLTIELRAVRDRDPQPQPEGPQGTESMIIHQDQPRYIGFRTEQENTDDD